MSKILNVLRKLERTAKAIYWDLSTFSGRFDYLNIFLRVLPKKFGYEVRSIVLPRWFNSCGVNLKCFTQVRFRNIDKISIGNDVCIGHDCFLEGGGEINIGDDVLLGPGVKIWSVNHKFERDSLIRLQPPDYKKVIIEDDVWIGSNAFIMPGAIIGKGTVVSAGSVVGAKYVEPYSILAGNPARKIGTR